MVMSAPALGATIASSGEPCWKRAASSPSTSRSMGRVRSRYSTLAPRLPAPLLVTLSRARVFCTARFSMCLAVTFSCWPASTRAASVSKRSASSFTSPLACNSLRWTVLSRSSWLWV
ncbi:hypothetical protein D3C81_1860240 [compost metagenome]